MSVNGSATGGPFGVHPSLCRWQNDKRTQLRWSARRSAKPHNPFDPIMYYQSLINISSRGIQQPCLPERLAVRGEVAMATRQVQQLQAAAVLMKKH